MTSFFDDVRRATDDFVARYSERIADLGVLTREFTTQKINDVLVKWAGLRLLYLFN